MSRCGGDGAPDLGRPYVGPGDIVPGATAFYGLRAYDARYAKPGTNPALKLRRASDQAMRDVAILATGSLDTATAGGFCGGTTCYVVTWYDQTRHGYDITQPAPDQQPELDLRACAGNPAVAFNYVRKSYLTGSFPWVTKNAPWTGQIAVLSVSPTRWYEPVFDYGVTTTNQSLFALVEDSDTAEFATSIYGTDDASGIAASAPVALTMYDSGAVLGGAANGIEWSKPFSGSDITGTALNVGGSPRQSGIWLTGDIGEISLYARKLPEKVIMELAASERAYYHF